MEGGARQLSGVLERLTTDEPKRFVSLLQKIPCDVNSGYVEGILRGLSNRSELEIDTVVEAVRIVRSRSTSEHEQSLAHLIGQHPSAASDAGVIEALVAIGRHGAVNDSNAVFHETSEADIISLQDLLQSGEMIHVRSIGTARGNAAEAIANAIWQVPAIVPSAWEFLDERVQEEHHLGVRCCLTWVAYALFNHDKQRCADTVERLINFDKKLVGDEGYLDAGLAPLATRASVKLLPFVVAQVPSVGRRLVDRLIVSENATFSLLGAWHAIGASYSSTEYSAIADEQVKAGVEQRTVRRNIGG